MIQLDGENRVLQVAWPRFCCGLFAGQVWHTSRKWDRGKLPLTHESSLKV